MKKIILIVTSITTCLFTFSCLVNAEGIKEGKWSITWMTKTDGLPPEAAAGMKAMDNMSPEMKEKMGDIMKDGMKKRGMNLQSFDSQGMTVTMTQCITSQMPYPYKSTAYCHETHEINGNTVHFNQTCNMSKGTADNNGYVTYNGDSMEGDTKSQVNMMNKSMSTSSHITGKYLGPCS